MSNSEISELWDSARNRPLWNQLNRWIGWRTRKTAAKWTGRPTPAETTLFWGQAMTIVYPEYVSSKIGRNGFFENDLTSMLIDVLRPGMTFYDVGSHFGYFSLLAAELVGPEGSVHSFEPTDATFQILRQNAARRPNITAHNVAAYRESGEISFWDQGVNGSSINFVVRDAGQIDPAHTRSGNLVSVPAVKLDDFTKDYPEPDFLKIDAEGAEGPILDGMSDLISRSHPAVSLEMGDGISSKTGNKPCRENLTWLLDHGYEVFDYQHGERRRHDALDHYAYANLLFQHPQWRFAQAALTRAA